MCNSKYIFDYGNTYIELLQETPCNNKMELRRHEHNYIRNMDCVNKYIPTRNSTEYYKDNKNKIKKNSNNRYHNKKEIISQNNKIKCNCDCGSIFRRVGKARHIKSIKHRQYIFNLHNELNHL